jgi:hypothetical protein
VLTDDDAKFLKHVNSFYARGGVAKTSLPVHPRILAFIERGYLRQIRLYCGPLRALEAEPGFKVTEAGQVALESYDAAQELVSVKGDT